MARKVLWKMETCELCATKIPEGSRKHLVAIMGGYGYAHEHCFKELQNSQGEKEMKIRRFRNRPKEIEAVEFTGDIGELISNIPAELEAKFDTNSVESPRIYNAKHFSWISFLPGDFIRIDEPGDLYPIASSYMEENYDEVTDDPG